MKVSAMSVAAASLRLSNLPRVQYDPSMRTRIVRLALIAGLLIVLASGCGGSKKSPTSSTTTRTTTAVKPTFKANLTATSHHPIVNNKKWAITVTVSDLSGKPIAATLRMNVLFNGGVVGKIDNGKVYHFVGRHHEFISWPQASVGLSLTLQAVVTAKGQTKKLVWPIAVVKK
jgi:hypothetical protein